MVETMLKPGLHGSIPDATGLIERLAERLGAQARASTIYGEPVDREGVTVVPVARAVWGCGGGSGRDDEQQVGSGGGGGMIVTPMGYIEIKDGESTYRPMYTKPVIVIAALVGLALGLVIARMFRCGGRG